MFGLSQEKPVKLETPSSLDGEYNPFDGVRVVAGKVVFEEAEAVNENELPDRSVTLETVKRLYDDEKLHRHIVKALTWIGKKKGYQSLQVDPGDEDFRDAVEVVYSRLSNSVAAPLLDRLGDEAFTDIVVITLGFGPVATGFAAEYSEKKKERRRAAEKAEALRNEEGAEDE